MIAITGATGQLGGYIIKELLKRAEGTGLIALARSPEKAIYLDGTGVKVRRANYNEKDSLRQAFQGAKTVMLISGTDIGERVEQHKNVVDTAKSAGVNNIVYTSVVIADKSPEPIYRDHKETEDYILASGLNYTFLRHNFYMDAYASEIDLAIERGVYRSPIGENGAALVSRRDLARAAACVLLTDKYANQTLNLTGPEKVTGMGFAHIATVLGGRPIAYEKVDFAELERDYRERGYPEDAMPILLLLEKTVASGLLGEVSNRIQAITGEAPESFESFVRDLKS